MLLFILILLLLMLFKDWNIISLYVHALKIWKNIRSMSSVE